MIGVVPELIADFRPIRGSQGVGRLVFVFLIPSPVKRQIVFDPSQKFLAVLVGGLFASAVMLVGNGQDVPDVEFEADALRLMDQMMFFYPAKFGLAGFLVFNHTVFVTKYSVRQLLGFSL